MDHLKPLSQELLDQLTAHCIPFREEFYECREDDGGRHDPIVDPFSQLTKNASIMARSNEACRQWLSLEAFLMTCRTRKIQQSSISGCTLRDPMVLRPRMFGKSINAVALAEALSRLAKVASRPTIMPMHPPGGHIDDGVFPIRSDFTNLGGKSRLLHEEFMQPRVDLSKYISSLGQFSHWPLRFRDYECKAECIDEPEAQHTTDFNRPRGWLNIPKQIPNPAKPTSALLALLKRAQ